MGRLLQETLPTDGQEVLQPTQFSPEIEKRFLPKFLWYFLVSLTSSFLYFLA
jgi:hypothetical protein